MSNMFMGTLTIKGPKSSTALGMSLEEMDRMIHCPENIDKGSWLSMCRQRREKIDMETRLYILEMEVREAEAIVAQREELHSMVEERLDKLKDELETFREAKARLIGNR